jgi:prepilin-type N-terminal cleavage/methylation domain-containing protein
MSRMTSNTVGTARGYTLIELLVVIGIIMLLASIMVPVLMSAVRRGHEAQCISQMNEIGHALATFRQDVGAYPDPSQNDPMKALVQGKYLPEVRTCPNDPRKAENNDTYGMLYNFWGYKVAAVPTLITATDYPTGGMEARVSARNKARAMARDTYKSIQDDITQATTNGTAYPAYLTPIPPGGLELWREGTVGAFPQDATELKQKEILFGYPEAEFPGLANSEAPPLTIVTICRYHLGDNEAYRVLRVDGSVALLRKQDRDTVSDATHFWTLSAVPK